MTNPTLERAARALALAFYQEECDESPGEFQKNFSQLTPEGAANRYWEGWTNQARAVLMAVREPDEAEKAGAFWLSEFQTPGSDTHLRAVAGNTFTAMIDAILNEEAK